MLWIMKNKGVNRTATHCPRSKVSVARRPEGKGAPLSVCQPCRRLRVLFPWLILSAGGVDTACFEGRKSRNTEGG